MYTIHYEYIFIATDDLCTPFQKYFLNVWKSLCNNIEFVFFGNKIFFSFKHYRKNKELNLINNHTMILPEMFSCKDLLPPLRFQGNKNQ